MKKLVGVLLGISIIAANASCNIGKPITATNVIAPAKLEVGQRAIVDLLSVDEYATAVFDYNIDDAFKGFEIWIEHYKNGVLHYKFHAIEVDIGDMASNRNGRIGIMINHNKMALSVVTNSQEKHFDTKTIEMDSSARRAWGPVDRTISIKNEQEIILYGYAFYDGDDITYGGQNWQVHPDILGRYPCVYLVKAKFSTKPHGGLTAEKVASIAKDYIKENNSQYFIDTIINFDTPIVEENAKTPLYCGGEEAWKVIFNVFSILGPVILYIDKTTGMVAKCSDLRI